jgi:choline kinase
MKIIILAAGRGIRLRPLTKKLPKSLIDVGNKPILHHILSMIQTIEPSEVVIVGGHGFPQLQSFLEHWNNDNSKFFLHQDSSNRSILTLLRNQQYRSGNLLSLMVAQEFFTEDLIIMNSDHIYPEKLFHTFISSCSENTTIACDFDRSLSDDDMKIHRTGSNYLKRISKSLQRFDGGYIGLTFIPKSMTKNYLDAMEQTLQDKGQNAVVEDVLPTLINHGYNIQISDMSGYGWLEIDTLDDLKLAEKALWI